VCLAERAGEVVTRIELVDRVWATEFIADNTLTHAITEIRNALGDDARNPSFIETIHRRGYRLIAPVEPAVSDDAGESRVARFPVPERLSPDEERSPYPGLAAFTEADAEFFFGRESEVAQMWRKLTSRKLLAVIGPSGVGKTVAADAYARWEKNVVKLTCSAGMSTSAFVRMLAQRSGAGWSGGQGENLRWAIRELQRKCPLVIVDGADELGRSVDVVRHVWDGAGCGIAVIGTGRLVEQLRRRRGCLGEQFLGRVGLAVHLEGVTAADAEALGRFAGVGESLAKSAFEGWPDAPGAEGSARRLINVFQRARMLAGNAIFDEQHLRQALRDLPY